MSRYTEFTSAEFALVPRILSARVPERLIHSDVVGTNDRIDEEFSSKRQHLVRAVKLPSQIVSLTFGRLRPGEATRMHRHNYESIIYFLCGHGRSLIEGEEVHWSSGDAIYVPVWAWHQHLSLHEAVEYLACENAPMLQNLGIALREEEGDV